MRSETCGVRSENCEAEKGCSKGTEGGGIDVTPLTDWLTDILTRLWLVLELACRVGPSGRVCSCGRVALTCAVGGLSHSTSRRRARDIAVGVMG